MAASQALSPDDRARVAGQEPGPQGVDGGGARARGARYGVLPQPGLEGADGGRRSSGEDGGEGAGPSTYSISLQSAGDAGEAAFLFFLERVILGEMISMLLF